MIITFANNKGGVGKTSLSTALCAGFTRRNKKTLLVDLDLQGNATWTARVEGDGAYDVLTGKKTAREAVAHTDSMGDVIPSSGNLAELDAALKKYSMSKNARLKEALKDVEGEYDYILIDTPRDICTELSNALLASDAVIIPISDDSYSVSGLIDLAVTIRDTKEYSNHNLEVFGVLPTRIDVRESTGRLLREAMTEIEDDPNILYLGIRPLDFNIRSDVNVKKASLLRKNIYEYDPGSPVIEDYERLIDLLIEHEDTRRNKK